MLLLESAIWFDRTWKPIDPVTFPLFISYCCAHVCLSRSAITAISAGDLRPSLLLMLLLLQ